MTTVIDLHPARYWQYGCTLCQRWHREGDALYTAHRWAQSRHGLRRVEDRTHWRLLERGA